MMVDAEHMPMNATYMDYPEHERTYRAFTAAAKWGTLVVAIIVVILVGLVLT